MSLALRCFAYDEPHCLVRLSTNVEKPSGVPSGVLLRTRPKLATLGVVPQTVTVPREDPGQARIGPSEVA